MSRSTVRFVARRLSRTQFGSFLCLNTLEGLFQFSQLFEDRIGFEVIDGTPQDNYYHEGNISNDSR
jgi:outer membrane protein W